MSSQAPSPFHRGEQAIQERLGVRLQVEEVGRRFIRDCLPEQHRSFYRLLSYVLIGTLDAEGRPWASVLAGEPGFIDSPDPRTLSLHIRPLKGDPAAENLRPGAQVGLLGIMFENRRRNRVNGRVRSWDGSDLVVDVDQTFGNCPQYIQARVQEPVPASERQAEPPLQHLGALDESARELIRRSDSFFIATQFSDEQGLASEGVDVSHRGGKPGFVRVEQDGTVTWPDYSGNRHFNTLGNLLLNPVAGLLFLDYESRDLLYLTGTAEIVWEGEELSAFTGAERLVRFRPRAGRRLGAALPFRWSFQEYSPVLEQTGTWEEVSNRLSAARSVPPLDEYLVEAVVRESDAVRSYYLAPADGGAPPAHVPGQFLPLVLELPDGAAPLRRTYTISNAPNGRNLRLSVKRELAPAPHLPHGAASSYLHEQVTEGSRLRALRPRGTFTLDESSPRPLVLLSAGVGITPMVAILEHWLRRREPSGPERRLWFVYGARNRSEHPFADHLRRLTESRTGVQLHVAYSAPGHDDEVGRDFHSVGRIDQALLQSLLPLDDYDFYLCGPAVFMADMHRALLGLGVPPTRIRYEFFGPASTLAPGAAAPVTDGSDTLAASTIRVRFQKSGIEAEWDPHRGSLLDLAESEGLTPLYSCRSGVCQTCSTRVLAGTVSYLEQPLARPEAGEALICCAVPQASGDQEALVLDL